MVETRHVVSSEVLKEQAEIAAKIVCLAAYSELYFSGKPQDLDDFDKADGVETRVGLTVYSPEDHKSRIRLIRRHNPTSGKITIEVATEPFDLATDEYLRHRLYIFDVTEFDRSDEKISPGIFNSRPDPIMHALRLSESITNWQESHEPDQRFVTFDVTL